VSSVRSSSSSIVPPSGKAGACNGKAGRSLGNLSGKVDRQAAAVHRLSRWAAKAEAGRLLFPHDPVAARNVRHCGYTPSEGQVSLVLDPASGKARFSGLRTCGAVWFCPVCAPRIAEKRKAELDLLMSGARSAGFSVVLLTLTARHNRETDLAGFLAALKGAARRLRQRREWRALPLVGSVVATELTHGANGWHPHFHLLMVLDCPAAEAVGVVERLRQPWLACLKGFDLTGNDAAFDAQDGSAAGAYIQKFGAAEEIALGSVKRGRSGSRTPWQLLDDAESGDRQAKALWQEYSKVFKGRRQLVWSDGLKTRFGVAEVSDDDAAAGADEAPEAEPVVLRRWDGEYWRSARRRRCALIEAAETGGDLDAAEFGPTDAERWRKLCGPGVVLEDS